MIERSAFDSEVFGLQVGKLGVSGLTAEALRGIRDEAAGGTFDVVFIRDLSPRLLELHTLDWTGLELMDLKVKLTRSLREGPLPEAGAGAETFCVDERRRDEDIDALAPIVDRIAERSRFVRAFGREAASRLYRRWLANSLAGQAADACFIARPKSGEEPCGLITVKYEGLGAELVLVATHARHEGKGVGRLLTARALASLASRGIPECCVGTQITNRAALRFYGTAGFVVDSLLADFHLRPRPRPAGAE